LATKQAQGIGTLQVVDDAADREFRKLLKEQFPSSWEWEERYVDHERRRIARVFESGILPIADRRVLEFGCHIGGTSIVLASAGGSMTGCDVNEKSLRLAQLNARRYGQFDRLALVRIGDGGMLPFRDRSFDAVVCNSVLEYVKPALLPLVMDELDRILKPGGHVVIYGTSNRLSPIEMHSRRWFVNYIPSSFDGSRRRARGLWPWDVRAGFAQYADVFANRPAADYLRARGEVSTTFRRTVMAAAAHLSVGLGFSPGFLTPWMFAILEKPSASSA